jgi:YD repeat-containing protein
MTNPLHVTQVVARSVLVLIVLTSAVLNVRSSTSATDGATPSALQPGAPAGSYALSGLDNINLFNGNLNFRLPLTAIVGRGEIGSSVTIPLERKWRVIVVQLPQPDGSVNYLYTPVASFWKTLPALFNPGGVEGRRAGYDITTCADGTTVYTQTLTRITFTTADGTEYELRDTLTNGRPVSNSGCNYLNPQSRGTVFASADGTGATFISDQTLYDQVVAPVGIGEFQPSGYLMLSDGTKYRIDSGRITWARDRNGNKISYDYDANNRVIAITDSLKRVLSITYASGGVTYDQLAIRVSLRQRILRISTGIRTCKTTH